MEKRKGEDSGSGHLNICLYDCSCSDCFFSREPGSRSGIELKLFSTWGQTAVEHAYFVENIIMFIPFGVLVPLVWKWMQKVQCCVLTGCVLSYAIELSQLITQRGYCQLDDVITNTAGSLIGWEIWKAFIGKLRSYGFCESGK